MREKLIRPLAVRQCLRVVYWRLAVIVLVLFPATTCAADETSDRLYGLKLEVRKDYPDVRHLTIENFLATFDSTVLVDVRAEEEFQVSRIPGAIHIDAPDKLLAFAAEQANKSIVLYCSVGVRSSEAAQLLQDHGFNKVANLEGSIFEWANEGRPLVNNQGSTNVVHPYNFWWGWRYLLPEVRAKLSPGAAH